MKRKAKASLTVETAMLFPIVFLLLLAVMQCALFLVYETYVKALCDQGVILCQSWYARGETLDTCVEEAKSYLSKQLHSCPWGEPSIYVHGEETIFTRTISLAVEGDYALLFPMRVEAITSGFLSGQRHIRRPWISYGRRRRCCLPFKMDSMPMKTN